jgi:hypothetical protein
MTQISKELETIEPAQRVEYLIGMLTLSRRSVGHMWVARLIFGSQIELLTRAASIGTASPEAMLPAYELHTSRGGKMSKSEWLAYLRTSGLITGDEMGIAITDAGRDFLSFIATILGESANNRPF